MKGFRRNFGDRIQLLDRESGLLDSSVGKTRAASACREY
jgi:hypothetical protein